MAEILKFCKENPMLIAVIAGLIIFLLVLLFITLSLAKKAKEAKAQLALMEAEKKRSAQKKATTKQNTQTPIKEPSPMQNKETQGATEKKIDRKENG